MEDNMASYIKTSVGLKSRNNSSDVKIIQTLKNFQAKKAQSISTLKVDDKCEPNTRRSIEQVQRYIIKMHFPDIRVDPEGRTERALTKHAEKLKQS